MTNSSDIIKTILGLSALILSLSYRLPQIYKLYKTKSGGDISKRSIIIQSASYIAWFSYSIMVNDMFYMVANLLSFSQNVIIWIMKYKYIKLTKLPEKIELVIDT